MENIFGKGWTSAREAQLMESIYPQFTLDKVGLDTGLMTGMPILKTSVLWKLPAYELMYKMTNLETQSNYTYSEILSKGWDIRVTMNSHFHKDAAWLYVELIDDPDKSPVYKDNIMLSPEAQKKLVTLLEEHLGKSRESYVANTLCRHPMDVKLMGNPTISEDGESVEVEVEMSDSVRSEAFRRTDPYLNESPVNYDDVKAKAVFSHGEVKLLVPIDKYPAPLRVPLRFIEKSKMTSDFEKTFHKTVESFIKANDPARAAEAEKPKKTVPSGKTGI